MEKSVPCRLCPRKCGARRDAGEIGFCGAPSGIRCARAALHFWEEPCISGTRGSGTVFFSGCPLRCCFCQNAPISRGCFGKDISEQRLSEIFLELQEKGAHNLNLVTATPYTDSILRVLDRIRGTSLHIPVVWNTGGYETEETLRRLEGYVDVYLPDLKFGDPALSSEYARARDYFPVASAAIREMVRQRGEIRYSEDGTLCSGVMIRHLVLPGGRKDSLFLADYLAKTYPPDSVLISLMSQYTPYREDPQHPVLNRRVTRFEYESVCDRIREAGFRGYFQEKQSAREIYTPPFDLEGV